MEVSVDLTDLSVLHPRLLWSEIAVATAVVLSNAPADRIWLPIECVNLPLTDGDRLNLRIDCGQVTASQRERVRRTYEAPRLIELAAIAVAGIAIYYGGGHEMLDVALRGSAADYLLSSGHLLEVAGRSLRSDFESAWQKRVARLEKRNPRGFYLAVVEFETPAGRLAFIES